jgi:hypothetical protein
MNGNVPAVTCFGAGPMQPDPASRRDCRGLAGPQSCQAPSPLWGGRGWGGGGRPLRTALLTVSPPHPSPHQKGEGETDGGISALATAKRRNGGRR